MKVLILRFSSIGDIVLTTPVIRAIKMQLPESKVHFATKSKFFPILEANPYLNKIHCLEGSLWEFAKQLRKEKFDVVIDLHHNLRTFLLKKLLGVKAYHFPKLNWEKWLYVNLKINILPNVHVVDRYFEAVKPLGVVKDHFGLDYFIPPKDVVELEWLPETHRKEYVVVAIGGQHFTKRLPLPKLIELCDRINKPIILLGGKEDAETAHQIEIFFQRYPQNQPYEEGLAQLNKKTLIFNGCGKFNINQSASIIQRAYAVFTHDTGLMHIAAAFHRRLFTIWGNTTPLFGMYPYNTSFTVFENNKISCRPCSKIGYSRCPKKHFKCMNDLVFDFYLP
ncbi:MAG: glycosyltransferase family 9 protein [Cytophagales bacterium]|nr:glycosyltransferase family 9 protein [Cytophagales bacterium]MDW8383829.1 glycosyltransferase family 9 protein [Flammeovirgaceae bacterium]